MTTRNASAPHVDRMDRKYARVRHVYDLTRKYFLFGRDAALDVIVDASPSSVLEIGCGTGRNLGVLARRLNTAELYGVDISSEMLKSANGKKRRFGNIKLAQADIERLDTEKSFGMRQFDSVLMSYCLSMMPDRKSALSKALKSVAPGGQLVIVDFGMFEGYGRLARPIISMLTATDAPPIPDFEALVTRSLSGRPNFSVEFDRSRRGYYRVAVISRSARK